jgi:hypothetical protein
MPGATTGISMLLSGIAPIEGTAIEKLNAAKAGRIRTIVVACTFICVILGLLSDGEASRTRAPVFCRRHP